MCLKWNGHRCVCASGILLALHLLCVFVHIFSKGIDTHPSDCHMGQTVTWFSFIFSFFLNPKVLTSMFPLLSLEQWMMRVNAQVKWPGSKSIVQASDPVAVAVGRNLFIWRVESKCISCTYAHNFKKHHWVNQGCIETDMYMIIPTHTETHIQAR